MIQPLQFNLLISANYINMYICRCYMHIIIYTWNQEFTSYSKYMKPGCTVNYPKPMVFFDGGLSWNKTEWSLNVCEEPPAVSRWVFWIWKKQKAKLTRWWFLFALQFGLRIPIVLKRLIWKHASIETTNQMMYIIYTCVNMCKSIYAQVWQINWISETKIDYCWKIQLFSQWKFQLCLS